MMYDSFGGAGMAAAMILVCLSQFACAIGVVLLLMWAYKHLPAATLKYWGIILFVGGMLLCLVLSLLFPFAMGHQMKWKMRGGDMMMKGDHVMMMKGDMKMMDMDDMMMDMDNEDVME